MEDSQALKCPACSHPAGAGARFCERCGAPLPRRCPECKAEVGASARFCSFCGQPLDELRGQDKARAEGERRTVTVLFADAVGSTAIAERLGEEEMYGLIQGCVERMVEAVGHYEGHVAHFTGDGVIAVFGAPVAHEESERRAVAAALRMQQALEDYAGEVRQRQGVECHYRVGLNTGPVVVGSVGSGLDMDFTAIGDTVNLAARMQQLAEPGSVYLTEATYRAVADHVECERLGPLPAKGKAEPVPAWRAVRERQPRTRFQVAAERGLGPFVGREEEVAALDRHLGRARQGRGEVVFLSGEPGIGKSRLLLEFRRIVAGTGVRWLQANCSPYGTSTPYLPVIELLKGAVGVEEDDEEARVIERVEAGTTGWPDATRATVPYLRYLLSVDPGDDRVGRMDPRERRAGILEGLRALLIAETARSPVVLVIEDLHWIDEASRTALGALVDLAPSRPVLLVLTHRPGGVQGLERAHTTRLSLDHLAADESVSLIQGVLGTANLPSGLERAIVEKAEGNPFYTEEVVRSLLQSGELIIQDGDCVLTRPLTDVRIPDTVQEVILARIDRLERPARGALQFAAVIGREFTARLLGRISDLEAELDETLAKLKVVELIYETAYFPELAFMFKHALTHDVAYSTLLVERRRALHRLVAAAIEELYGERLAEHYEMLAHHYYEGQSWPKALDYLARAGRKAAAAFANQDALDHYARALAVGERLGDSTLRTQADLAHRRAYVNFGVGRFPDAIADMERMLRAARRLGDRHLEGTALVYRGCAETWGHVPSAEATLLEAVGFPGDGHMDVRVLASLFLSLIYVVQDRHDEVEPLMAFVHSHASFLDDFGKAMWGFWASRLALWAGHVDEALRLAEEGRQATEAAMPSRLSGLWNHAHALATKGNYEAALAVLEETMAMCERVGDVIIHIRCLNTMGWVYAELHDFERALDWNRRGVEAARAVRAPVPEVEMQALLNVAENLHALGRVDEAEERFAEAERVVRDRNVVEWMRWRYAQRFLHSSGELWLSRGEISRALACADECLARAERSRSLKYIAKCRRLRGQVFFTQGRLDEAEAELTAAVELATKVGNPPQLWKSYVALGDLRAAQGRPDRSRQDYRDAVALIDSVAAFLTDASLRSTFLASDHIGRIREAAAAPG